MHRIGGSMASTDGSRFAGFRFAASTQASSDGTPAHRHRRPKRAEALLAGEKRLLEMVASGSPLPMILDALCVLVEETASGVSLQHSPDHSDGHSRPARSRTEPPFQLQRGHARQARLIPRRDRVAWRHA